LIIFYFTDLSFNNIREIQGLDKLKKLKDLSLAHNFIQEVDGLKSLKELQLLSLGHNELSNLQHTALYLRELCSLQSVCLRGNKFSPTPQHITSGSNSENAETFRQYQMYCIAIIPSLIYLDYQMILDDMRSIACDQHSEFIQEIEHKEKDEKLKLEAKKIYKEKEHQYTTAYVNGLDGEEFYNALFEEDPEAKRLALLPEETERLEAYYKQVLEICKEMVQIGLEHERKRCAEREMFFTSHRKALEANQSASFAKVQAFEKEKVKLLSDNQSELFGEKITEFHYAVIKLEMQLVDQIDDIIKEFERNYSELVNNLLESIQAKMTQLRDIEKEHNETILEQSTQLLEAYSKGQLEDELPDGLKILFVDKDTLMSAINAAHDTHMMVIDNKEDSIRARAEKDKKLLLEDIVEREYTRNRQRIIEITQHVDIQHQELEDWLNGIKD
jgi:hypothetical protein